MMTWHLAYHWYTYIIVRTSTPDIHAFLIFLTCSCSFPESDNHLINHKMRQLASGRGKHAAINTCSCLQWFRYVVQLYFPVWPEGLQATEGSAGSLLLRTILTRATYKTLLLALRQVPSTKQRNNPGPWSRVCTGPTVNMVHWYPRWFPITTSFYLYVDVCVLGRYYTYLDIRVERVTSTNNENGVNKVTHALSSCLHLMLTILLHSTQLMLKYCLIMLTPAYTCLFIILGFHLHIC